MLRWRAGLATIVTATLIGGCGSGSTNTTPPRTDGWGDPYITDAQGRSIHVGESEAAAFRALGGEAQSGSHGAQAPVREVFEYPIRGTGNPSELALTEAEAAKGATWWEICVEYGRVVGKERGKGELTDDCSGPETQAERER
jgi:hypothetical protein